MFRYSLIVFLFAIVACTETSDQQHAKKDTLPSIDTTKQQPAPKELHLFTGDSIPGKGYAPADYISFVDKKLSKWVRYYKTLSPQFDLNTFTHSSTLGFSVMRQWKFQKPITKDDSLTTGLYCWSPDRRFIADVYSQRHIFSERQGKTVLTGGDPESGIILTVIGDSTSYLIEYTGSMQSYEDVAWMDDRHFIVTGTFQENDSIQPYFEAFDIAASKQIIFFGKKMPPRPSQSYNCIKFPEWCEEN